MLQTRPPVVVVMGHVDHGKTSLLDRIRQTKVVTKEAGQITQAIGAYQVIWKDKKITFLDTPGHEAFIKMRARGAMVADIAVLVVAADDGVMPQTKESIKIIKEAGLPFIVAINKIDLTGVSIDKIKRQLAENEVFAEGYGGQVVVVPISAKTGQGVEQLLEMILLTVELEELKADPEGNFEGVVIESKKDKFKGDLATILVKNGILKVGEEIITGNIKAKVKSLTGDLGQALKEALPGQPVEILGWEGPPLIGAVVKGGGQGNQAESAVAQAQKVFKAVEIKPEEQKIKIIFRADSAGSLEAILNSLPDNVQVLLSGTGEICESDVLLAKTFSALIIGFNIKVSGQITKLAQTEKIKIRTYGIIYDLFRELEEIILNFMDPLFHREVVGKAEVIAEFDIKRERVAGVKVISGKITKTDKICLLRGKEIFTETRIRSMRHGKEEITQAVTGTDFGIIFNSSVKFQKGDVLVACRE